jgi:alcohol dehydrogenase class IV
MDGDLKPFQFRSPRIIFKREAWKDLGKICSSEFGPNGVLVIGSSFKDSEICQGLLADFEERGSNVAEFLRKGGEPTVAEVDDLAGRLRDVDAAWVLGIGGGSTLDLAKSAAGLARNEYSAAIYQEGLEVPLEGIPFVAVPTTAGTGSEVTNNAVLINEDKRAKLSIRGEKLIAKIAVLDPVLTLSAPPDVTAYSGLDALVQAIEAFVSKACNPFSDLLAEKAIGVILQHLFIAWSDGSDLHAREGMLYGNLLSALAFSNAKLGAIHGFAHPIGAQFGAPHGLITGLLLPHVMRFNLGDGDLPDVTAKFATIGRLLHVGSESEIDLARAAIDGIVGLLDSMQIPRELSGIGIGEDDIPAIVADTKGSSLDNNPRATTKEVLAEILSSAL